MSNAFDKASLVMLPHAYEEGKLYSLKPTDRSGDFTFSRGTDTATRVGEDGYIKKETSNLLLQSNSFDTTWSTSVATITGGQSDKDGGASAWLLEASSTGSSRYAFQNISTSGVNTFSVYAKAGTSDYIRIQINASSTSFAYFDISAGTAGTTLNDIDTDIEDVGSGWYRCSLTMNNSSITAVRIYVAALNSVSVTAGDNIYIQDAQINQGLVAYPYLETTTAPVYGGLTDDMPRLDYSGGATCPSLLLEPSRTNLIGYSEAIEFGISTNGCTQTITNETNPSGNDVSYLVGAIDDVNDQIRYDKFGLSLGSYFISVFVKGDGNANEIRMRGTGTGTTTGNVYWDVAADGTITLDTSASPSGVNAITESYGNGWYRIGLEETFDGTGRIAIYPSRGGVNISTYIWGVQWEAGSYPTSYIPTYGSSQTRGKDNCSVTGISSLFGQTEGTLFLELEAMTLIGDPFIALYANSSNYLEVNIGASVGTKYEMRLNDGTNSTNPRGGTSQVNTTFKLAIKVESGNQKTFVDGTEIISTSIALDYSSTPLSILAFNRSNGNNHFFGKVKQTLVLPEALSDSECIALTTV